MPTISSIPIIPQLAYLSRYLYILVTNKKRSRTKVDKKVKNI